MLKKVGDLLFYSTGIARLAAGAFPRKKGFLKKIIEKSCRPSKPPLLIPNNIQKFNAEDPRSSIVSLHQRPTYALSPKPKVLIIGAGIAGLTCAAELAKKQIPYQIVEATNRIGGRIYTDHSFFDGHLELGAEELHSAKSSLTKVIQRSGVQLKDFSKSKDVLYDSKTKTLRESDDLFQKYPDALKVKEKIEQQHQTIDPSLSLEEFLKKYQISSIKHYFDSVYGAEYGGTNSKIGAKAMAECENVFFDQYSTFGFKNSNFGDIQDRLFKHIYPKVEMKTVVQKIDAQKDTVNVVMNNKTHKFRYVVCTVPLTQLNKINWAPQLSQEKLNIMEKHIRMNKGGKFFIQTDKRIYDINTVRFFLDTVPNVYYWQDPQRPHLNLITALVTGRAYQMIQEKGIDAYAKLIEKDMQTQLKTDAKFVKYHFEDWGKTPYIEGCYSCPRIGYRQEMREVLAKPHRNRVFFAGEAYHKTDPATIHGAYETALEVSQKIINLL